MPTWSRGQITSLVKALTGASLLPRVAQRSEAQPLVVRTEQAVGWATTLDQSGEEWCLPNGVPGSRQRRSP